MSFKFYVYSILGWPVAIQSQIEAHGREDPEVQDEIEAQHLEGKPIKGNLPVIEYCSSIYVNYFRFST